MLHCFDKTDPSSVYNIYTNLSLYPFNCIRNSLHSLLTKCRSYRLENSWIQISLSRRCPDFLIFFSSLSSIGNINDGLVERVVRRMWRRVWGGTAGDREIRLAPFRTLSIGCTVVSEVTCFTVNRGAWKCGHKVQSGRGYPLKNWETRVLFWVWPKWSIVNLMLGGRPKQLSDSVWHGLLVSDTYCGPLCVEDGRFAL